MKIKKILPSLFLLALISVPSTSSAMTVGEIKDSLDSVKAVLNTIQSVVNQQALKGVSSVPLTSGIVGEISYDANGDGKVDVDDLTFIEEARSSSAYVKSADLDGNGVIENKDIFALRNHFLKNKDYINAYDLPNIGAGWKVIDPNGKIDEGDINMMKFVLAVVDKDPTSYSALADLNMDGRNNESDMTVIESYLESQNSAPISSVQNETPITEVDEESLEVLASWPSGELSVFSGPVWLAVITDIPSDCRYSFVEGTSFNNMEDFQISGTEVGDNSHLTVLENLPKNKQINVYVKCKSLNSSVTEIDYSMSFSLGKVFDGLAPTVTKSFPDKVLESNISSYNVSMITDMPASCRYSFDSNHGSFESMTAMKYTSVGTDKNMHFQPVSGLKSGDNKNMYVRCKSLAGVVMTSDYIVNIKVNNL